MRDLANVIFLQESQRLHKEKKDMKQFVNKHKETKETIGYKDYYIVPCLYEGCK